MCMYVYVFEAVSQHYGGLQAYLIPFHFLPHRIQSVVHYKSRLDARYCAYEDYKVIIRGRKEKPRD
jgi:hypothetical protein